MDFRDVAIDTIDAGLKTAAKEAAIESLKGHASEAVGRVIGEAVGAAASALALPLLRALLGCSNAVSVKLDVLIANPMKTGCSVAIEALEAQPSTPEEREFWLGRMRMAVEELDRALSNASNRPNTNSETLYIQMLQGLCALRIPGGQTFGATRLASAASILESEANELRPRSYNPWNYVADSYFRSGMQSREGLPFRILREAVFMTDRAVNLRRRSTNSEQKRQRANELEKLARSLRGMA